MEQYKQRRFTPPLFACTPTVNCGAEKATSAKVKAEENRNCKKIKIWYNFLGKSY
jgi:hypothetical protein